MGVAFLYTGTGRVQKLAHARSILDVEPLRGEATARVASVTLVGVGLTLERARVRMLGHIVVACLTLNIHGHSVVCGRHDQRRFHGRAPALAGERVYCETGY